MILVALFVPLLRYEDSWLMPQAWTLVIVGLMMIIIAVTLRTRWRIFGVYFSLAMVSQWLSLLIIVAPNYGVIQHFLTWSDLIRFPNVLVLCILLGLSCLAIWKIFPYKEIFIQIWKIFRPFQWIILLSIFAFSLVVFSRSPLVYFGEILLAGWITILIGIFILLATLNIPPVGLEKIKSFLQTTFSSEAAGRKSFPDRAFPYLVAFFVTLFSALYARNIFEGIPHLDDDIAFLFMAKYFSKGLIYLPAPPDPKAFEMFYALNDGIKWYGYGFLGWPVVLSIGVLIKAPWLVNPVLAGLTILAAHAWISRLYNSTTAHLSISLMIVSPWFLFTSASMMTHSLSLLLMILALLALERAESDKKWKWGLASGLCLAGLFLTRPLEGVMIGIVLGFRVLRIPDVPLKVKVITATAVVTILLSSIHLFYNHTLTGSYLTFPMAKYFDVTFYPGAQRLGFGPDVGNVGWDYIDPLPGHGPMDILVNGNQNAFLINFETFGWGFGSLFFVLVFLISRQWNRSDKFLLTIILVIVAGNSFYFFSGGPDYGARYWYLMFIPLVVLTIRGAAYLGERWMQRGGSDKTFLRIGLFVAIASSLVMITFLPWRSMIKYHHYRDIRADIAHLAQENDFDNGLIFIQEKDESDYPSAFVFNPPTLNDPGPIYARDLGLADRQELIKKFPGRKVWVIAGPSKLGGPFSIISRP